jgi:putative endonuclease
MDDRRCFGNAAEAVAARYLEGKGYKILARQFRTRFGEIDLVAEKDGELVFIEVKARKNLNFGYPEAAVDARKMRKLATAANIFMEQNQKDEFPFRFDVLAMLLKDNNEFEIEHLEAVDMNGEEC